MRYRLEFSAVPEPYDAILEIQPSSPQPHPLLVMPKVIRLLFSLRYVGEIFKFGTATLAENKIAIW